jgi:aminocarboxymuconate-semialdehyde decarboxylase
MVWIDLLETFRILNDDIATTIAKHPTRFIGLGTVPLQSAETAIQELKRCLFKLGLAGIQIGSHINGNNLDAEYLDPFWAACNELQVPVFVHPWDMEKKG